MKLAEPARPRSSRCPTCSTYLGDSKVRFSRADFVVKSLPVGRLPNEQTNSGTQLSLADLAVYISINVLVLRPVDGHLGNQCLVIWSA